MHKALHPRDDVDKICVFKKEVRRGLANIEDRVDASIQRLEDYIEKRGERLSAATRNNTDETRTSRSTINRKQKWEEKQLDRRFKQVISNNSPENNVEVAKNGKLWEKD